MNKWLISLMMVFLLFVAVNSAYANTGFGIFTLAPYFLILPLIYLFMLLGGVHLIVERKKRYRRMAILLVAGYIVLTILVFLISAYFGFDGPSNFGFYLIPASFPFFGVLIGGFMIYLGIRYRLPNRPSYLAPVRSWRIIVSGAVLIGVVFACLFWTYQLAKVGMIQKDSEARTIMTGIYEAEMVYFSTENTFSTDPEAIGFEPASHPKYYQWEIILADERGFLARVWGNTDKDPDLDIWEQTDRSREPYHIFNDKFDEGVQIDPRDPKPYTPSEWGSWNDEP